MSGVGNLNRTENARIWIVYKIIEVNCEQTTNQNLYDAINRHSTNKLNIINNNKNIY